MIRTPTALADTVVEAFAQRGRVRVGVMSLCELSELLQGINARLKSSNHLQK